MDGHAVSGRREKVWSTGPGLIYAFKKENVLSANACFEQQAQNRTEDNKLVLNWLHKF